VIPTVYVSVRSISAARRDDLLPFITADERVKMLRFVRDADQMRFLVGRSTLRREVARRRGLAPLDVPIEYGAYGKPLVPGGPHVNVSHSGDIVIVAVCDEADLGVDVEEVDPRHASGSDLRTFFSVAERAAIAKYSGDARVAAFFQLWTTKEALIKAVATGLSLSLQSFDTVADPDAPPALLAARCQELAVEVTLATLAVPAGYRAVLALLAPSCRITYQ
jgi:4'-phosphopantetheinyl transferase